MMKKQDTKKALIANACILMLCISMFIGSTFAWFTDTVVSEHNIITTGKLDLEMYWTDDLESGEWHNIEDEKDNSIFSYDNWEPGYTDVKYIKLKNVGNLALNYQLSIEPKNGVGKLAEVINVYFAEGGVTIENQSDLQKLKAIGLLSNILNGGETADGTLLAAEQYSPLHPSGEVIVTVAMNMLTSAGNTYQNEDAGKFTITALATQAPFEKDSFGSDYDLDAAYPTVLTEDSASAKVNPVDGKVPEGGITLNGGKISAFVPEGVVLKEGTSELTLTVTPLKNSTSDISVVNDEILIPVDVHIDGVAENNSVPIIINLGEVLPKYLNMGNYYLYHVEDGTNSVMTLVQDKEALIAHNQFTYDSDTGAVSVAMASFSEVTMLANTDNPWKGGYDANWYNTTDTAFTISKADELYAFAKIVGGMADGIEKDTFENKTVTLIQNINLGGGKAIVANKTKVFYPIGYYNTVNGAASGIYDRDDAEVEGKSGVVSSNVSAFKGTFNGNGHIISNFYQNTWEMFGDYNSGYTGTPNYYKDAMGLFGYVKDGIVENLTVDSFSSDGEFTPTGVIAAYAVNSTFKNIAIKNCNPRVYNTGNGGIVGIGGNSDDASNSEITFTNITVDNSNTISALWGSWDVACGGIMGMFRGNSHVEFENCHVAAKIDVYNDVCGNYQYYWYRYAGMMIGSLREKNIEKDGYTVPDLTGITASGCTISFDEWNDYYYCELVDNSIASYTHDYQFSRLDQVYSVNTQTKTYKATEDSEETPIPTEGRYNFVTLNGGYETENATCYHFVDGKVWNHEDAGFEDFDLDGNGQLDDYKEDNAHIYLPFNQVFQGDGWGVKHIAIAAEEGSNLNEQVGYESLDIKVLDRNLENKFQVQDAIEDKNFLFRVGNGNAFPIGKLFKAKENADINKSGVYVSVTSLVDGVDIIGTFTLDETNWENSTLKISGTGPAKITIQDYSMCEPTELFVEVVDAKNLTTATGTTSGGNFVLLCDVNASNYVNYWYATLYGNGFTYSLNGAPTNYSSSNGHGVIITKNATLDNVVIVGDVYDEYGAYTTNNCYNAAIDVLGDTIIQNCYISGCSAPVLTRANATIKNTTLYGGAVANLMIKGGEVTLENVITANYDDGRDLVGMGIVVHSDAAENAKLVLNGTLTQYNFIDESNVPNDMYAENLHGAMFESTCSQYHFGTSPNRQVNTGIISLTDTFDADDIIDNIKTGYVGKEVSLSGNNGYVYTQLNTQGSVNNNYSKDTDPNIGNTNGPVAPNYSFDYTTKNYKAKEDGSNDYCYAENGTVYISMDDGDTFNWDTAILTVTKGNESLDYTVSMNGTDYTGKDITFNTAGDYEVQYHYTDPNNSKLDENGNIVSYSETYTKTVKISVAVIKETTKHAVFTMGSSKVATEKITVDNATYISASGVEADNTEWTYITINGQKIYYPIVAAKLTSTKGSSSYAYFPVFENVVTITDYADGGTGDAVTYNASTTTLPSGLTAVKGIYKKEADVTSWTNLNNSHLTQSGASKIFKWASSSDAPSDPVQYDVDEDSEKELCYKSPSISADRDAYITLVQYSYTDAANTTYYYYVGYTLAAFEKQTTCVTSDTLVTLADGTQKYINEVTYNDRLLVWDFNKGEYTVANSSIIENHGYDWNDVITLIFEDGTKVKVVNAHGFFDADLNKWVDINAANVNDYIGHNFMQVDGDSYKTVRLTSANVSNEYVEAWSILTAEHYNCIVEDMFSITPPATEQLAFFEIGNNMKYDMEAKQAAIEKYGLFDYEEFEEYLTYEQFDAFNVAEFKVAIGKGLITYEELLWLIETYVN